MSEFSSRSSGYKAGVVLLFFSAIAFFVGYTTPFWFYYAASSEHLIKKERSSDYSRSEGLWMMCESGTRFSGFFQTRCVTYPLDIVLPWFHAVRALASISLIGLFMACVYALVTNCCRSIPGPVTSILEALSVFSGCAVLAAEAATKEHFGWSLKLSAIGSGLCVVAAFIIAVFKPLPTSALGAVGQVITMATISQVQSYTTAGGQAQAQPFRNPQSYGGPQSYGNPQPYGNPQSYGNAQPYGNPQAYGNVYGYGNPEPYGNPTTYPGPQPNNQADQA
ncbi:uncharacterized protein [Littorina saxatilis]|uniref:uncharacterized protein isoform X2 n=1 Tax=Littorina saxatilis TaxID=31220 RepID=UPI0038B572A2